MVYENDKHGMKIIFVGRLASGGMLGLLMVLVGFGSNDNRLRVWERVEWMVCHSYSKHLHQRPLSAICQYSEESVIVIVAIPVHALRK